MKTLFQVSFKRQDMETPVTMTIYQVENGVLFSIPGNSYDKFSTYKDAVAVLKDFINFEIDSSIDFNTEITAEVYCKLFGYPPVDDDLERINCKKTGFGHSVCGWCKEHNKARFMCGCQH